MLFPEKQNLALNFLPETTREYSHGYYALHVIHGEVVLPFLLKKCCKKYKKGKRCKKCPAH